MAKIICLNGISSAGKSSIAKAIQHMANEAFIKIGVDTFIEMMPAKYLSFGTKSQEGCFLQGVILNMVQLSNVIRAL